MTKYNDDRLDWYRRTMTVDGVIPEGVQVDLDVLRAENPCEVCDELVDAHAGRFSVTRCARCESGE